jgi:hypothetical protein
VLSSLGIREITLQNHDVGHSSRSVKADTRGCNVYLVAVSETMCIIIRVFLVKVKAHLQGQIGLNVQRRSSAV